MLINFRIPADDEYLGAIGRAHYNFVTLEWCAVNIFVKLDPQGHAGIPTKSTAGRIANILKAAIDNANPRLSSTLELMLNDFHGKFFKAIEERNMLLHANPATAPTGEQILVGKGREWPIEDVYAAAKSFEDIAIEGNYIYFNDLKNERP